MKDRKTLEELLINKLKAEFEEFKNFLIEHYTAEKIITLSYEYTYKELIVNIFSNNIAQLDLSNNQYNELISLPNTLQTLYDGWLKWDETDMDQVVNSIRFSVKSLILTNQSSWVYSSPFSNTEMCMKCNYNIPTSELRTPFCPWCGRKMMNYGKAKIMIKLKPFDEVIQEAKRHGKYKIDSQNIESIMDVYRHNWEDGKVMEVNMLYDEQGELLFQNIFIYPRYAVEVLGK